MSVPLKARLLLADDHAMVRRGLRHVLEAVPDLVVAAEAGDGREAVELALREDFDLAEEGSHGRALPDDPVERR